MRTLIIPDIHNHTLNADHWLHTQRFDRVVFLGDFFDDYGDNVNDAWRTATWLRKRMDSNDDIFLLGNHDASYMFPRFDALYCPGFTKAKAVAIHEVLQPEHWQRFKLAHFEQGWLLSHAGFHPVWIKAGVERIIESCREALKKAATGAFHPLLGIGVDRAGGQAVGGPLWLDWDSLAPIAGVNQIVGHTPDDEVRKKITRDSRNYCLDVKNASVAAILSGGKVTILNRD